MATANTTITTLSTDNTISEIMLKVNELIYELNGFYHGSFDYAPISANTAEWLEGRVFYNQDDYALAYFNDDPTIFINSGQDVVVRVQNNKESDIERGKAIYIDGAANNIPTVDLAIANTSSSSSIVVGVAKGAISANTTGYMSILGKVSDVDTSEFSDGDVLYLSDTVLGGFTNVKPVNKLSIKLGLVTFSDSANGTILVNSGPDASSMESYFTFVDPQLNDVILHDGFNFTNTSKLNLTDGGNF